MGVSAADYDMDGNFDIVKTNFAGDTPSLYRNQVEQTLKTPPSLLAGPAHAVSRVGCGFFDMDNDGWARYL